MLRAVRVQLAFQLLARRLLQRLHGQQIIHKHPIPRAVGTRPAEVCGLITKPMFSRSASTLRIDALERSSPECIDKVREPTGWPSAI